MLQLRKQPNERLPGANGAARVWLLNMENAQKVADQAKSLHETTVVPAVSDVVLWLGAAAAAVMAWGEWVFLSPTPVKVMFSLSAYAGFAMVLYRLKHARNQEKRSRIELARAERTGGLDT